LDVPAAIPLVDFFAMFSVKFANGFTGNMNDVIADDVMSRESRRAANRTYPVDD
jgi:hypothetical protein